MGIFSKWSILEKVEDRLETQIVNNLLYPFTRENENVFKFHHRSNQFAVSSFLSVICALVIVLWVSITSPSQALLFPSVLCVGGAYFAYSHRLRSDYVVNNETGKYSYYKGGELWFEGSMHNMYLRLHEKITSGFPYYYIVLNGYKVDSVSISGSSKNLKKMRELGKGMSKRLGINYFDVKDVSPQHIVYWERPAHIETSSHSMFEDEPDFEVEGMPTLNIASHCDDDNFGDAIAQSLVPMLSRAKKE